MELLRVASFARCLFGCQLYPLTDAATTLCVSEHFLILDPPALTPSLSAAALCVYHCSAKDFH